MSQWPAPSASSKVEQNPYWGSSADPRAAGCPDRVYLDDVLNGPGCAVLDRGRPALDPAPGIVGAEIHHLEAGPGTLMTPRRGRGHRRKGHGTQILTDVTRAQASTPGC